MAQDDVYNFLRNRRLSGDDTYISIKQLYSSLLDMKGADMPSRRRVWESIKQLKKYDYIEVRGVGEWPSYIRLKNKHEKHI